jgi:hypothetical protein
MCRAREDTKSGGRTIDGPDHAVSQPEKTEEQGSHDYGDDSSRDELTLATAAAALGAGVGHGQRPSASAKEASAPADNSLSRSIRSSLLGLTYPKTRAIRIQIAIGARIVMAILARVRPETPRDPVKPPHMGQTT